MHRNRQRSDTRHATRATPVTPSRAEGEPYTDGLAAHHDFAAFQIRYAAWWMAYYAPLQFALMLRGPYEEPET